MAIAIFTGGDEAVFRFDGVGKWHCGAVFTAVVANFEEFDIGEGA